MKQPNEHISDALYREVLYIEDTYNRLPSLILVRPEEMEELKDKFGIQDLCIDKKRIVTYLGVPITTSDLVESPSFVMEMLNVR